MCILLNDCTDTIVIRLTNNRTQIAGSVNNVTFQKNESFGARKEN